jgi:hypothetical protein
VSELTAEGRVPQGEAEETLWTRKKPSKKSRLSARKMGGGKEGSPKLDAGSFPFATLAGHLLAGFGAGKKLDGYLTFSCMVIPTYVC